MGKLRVPPPPDYMMNPGNHEAIKKYEKMIEVINQINHFIVKIDEERNIMCENILRILDVPEKDWWETGKSELL
jgi:hypothetical protein